MSGTIPPGFSVFPPHAWLTATDLTGLPDLPVPSADDILYGVDDPTGAAIPVRLKIGNMFASMGTVIGSLPSLVTPDLNDIFYIVHNPLGSPIDENITVQNLFTNIPKDTLAVGVDQFVVDDETVAITLTDINYGVLQFAIPIRLYITPGSVPVSGTGWTGIDLYQSSNANLGSNVAFLNPLSVRANYNGPSTIMNTRGTFSVASLSGIGGISYAQAEALRVENSGAGVIAEACAMRILSAINSGAGSITYNYGIYIEAQIVGTARNLGIFNLAPTYLAPGVGIGDLPTADALRVVGAVTLIGSTKIGISTNQADLSIEGNIYGRYIGYPDADEGYYKIGINNISADSGGMTVSYLENSSFKVGFSLIYNGCFGIGEINPAAKLEVNQNNIYAAFPCLDLDQDDDDEPFINYVGTTAADQTKSISTKQGDGAVSGPKLYSSTAGWEYAGMVKVEINGASFWMPYYQPDLL